MAFSEIWSAVTRHRFPQATCRRRTHAASKFQLDRSLRTALYHLLPHRTVKNPRNSNLYHIKMFQAPQESRPISAGILFSSSRIGPFDFRFWTQDSSRSVRAYFDLVRDRSTYFELNKSQHKFPSMFVHARPSAIPIGKSMKTGEICGSLFPPSRLKTLDSRLWTRPLNTLLTTI